MRTSYISLTAAIVVSLFAACTVKDVEVPGLAGPSTLAYSILLTASTDTLTQDGVSSATIEITARDTAGQLINGRPLRAEIWIDGVVQDYGTLSTKTPVTGQTIRYTAPPASTLAAGNVAQTITIAVIPTDSGDFANEIRRQVQIRLVPQGVILPSNPNLAAAFTVTPPSPQAFSLVTFDASTTINGGVACNTLCSYAWNFGDGTTGTGQTTTHEYRVVGSVQVTLSVTDSRGATATAVRTVTVTASTPPTASFVMQPNPVGINQDVFFNAETSRATLPRRIVSYGWNFGDGRTASGVTVSRSFPNVGSYTVILTVTDDAGAVSTPPAQQTLVVSAAGAGMSASMTVSPSTASPAGTSLFFNASASTSASPIVEYRFSWGDGTPDVAGTSSTQSHQFGAAGTYVVRLTIRDSLGRTATTTINVVVT